MNISRVVTTESLYASSTRQSRDAASSSPSQPANQPSRQAGQQLTADEQKQVQKLKERDRQVRQHEQAHMTAGAGIVTSGARYSYQKGPDGVNYAIGGEVGISTAPGRTPDETIQRAQQIRAAALAPADPSGQDRAVAAQATQMEQRAWIEKSQQSDPANSPAEEQKATAMMRAYAESPASNGTGLSVYA